MTAAKEKREKEINKQNITFPSSHCQKKVTCDRLMWTDPNSSDDYFDCLLQCLWNTHYQLRSLKSHSSPHKARAPVKPYFPRPRPRRLVEFLHGAVSWQPVVTTVAGTKHESTINEVNE